MNQERTNWIWRTSIDESNKLVRLNTRGSIINRDNEQGVDDRCSGWDNVVSVIVSGIGGADRSLMGYE